MKENIGAEFERDIIAERVKAGMANAKWKGKHVGRLPVATPGISVARLMVTAEWSRP